jgi:phosphatidylserine/phosphatidylglycerophosphate/cardiolipin synthase-like enzyme
MHNKTVAVDDAKVATGSFNFSMNATKNAENVLVIENADTATQYRNYIQDLVKTYGKPKK